MSKTVDQRVVKMEFDNQRFEQRVETTRKSLRGLKEDLNFDKSAKHLESLDKAVNGIDFSGMSSNLENISNKFSAMGVVGFTVLQNLTNGVLNFGKKIADSTIGQMISGGRNRALNLEQAQFQISGLGVDWKKQTETGKSLYDQIDKAVSGTAYGLDAAAKVAGQLLASNIDAGTEKMQNALSGISGVAAMTNSTYEEIGNIFTTIAGNGRLMTEQLNQFAGRGLNVAATLAEHLHVTEAELRDMVTKGKVDFNTFAEAMNKAFGKQATKANDTYTGSLSNVRAALSRIGAEIQQPYLENMRQTFVALIPVLNSVKTSLKPVFDVVAKGMASFRTEIVKTLNGFAIFDKEGKTVAKGIDAFAKVVKKFVDSLFAKDLLGNSVFDYLKKSYESTKSIFKELAKLVSGVISPIKKGLQSSFFGDSNPLTSFARMASNALSRLNNFIEVFSKRVSELVNKNDYLIRIAKGFGAALKIVWELVKNILNLFSGFGTIISPVVEWILKCAAALGDYAVILQTSIKRSGVFKSVVETIKTVFEAIGAVFVAVVTKIRSGFKALRDGFTGVDNGVISRITNALKGFIDVLKEFAKALKDTLLGDSMKSTTGLLDKLASVGIIATFINLKKQLKNAGPLASFSESLKNIASSFNSLVSNISSLFGNLGTVLKDFNKKLKSEVFLNIAKGLLMIAAALFVLATIDADSLYSSIVVMGLLFTEIASFMKSFSKSVGNSSVKGMLTSSSAMVLLSGAVLILSGAIKTLSKVPTDKALSGVLAVSALLEVLVVVMDQIGNSKTKEISKGMTGLIALSLAVRILTNAVVKLSELSWDGLAKGIVAISAILGALIGFVRSVGKPEKLLSTAFSLTILGASLEIMANVVKRLSEMPLDKLGIGIGAFVVLIGAMVGFIRGVGKPEKMLSTAIGLVVLSSALEVMVHVAERLGKMPLQQMAQGLVGVGAILIGFTLFVNKSGKSKNVFSTSLSMIVLASAMEIIAHVCERIASLPIEGVAASVGAISVLMYALYKFISSIADKKMNMMDLLAMSFSLKIFTNSLIDISKAIESLASLSLGGVMQSVGSILVILYAVYVFAKNIGKDIADIGFVVAAIVALALGIKVLSSVSIFGAILAITTLAATFGVLFLGVKILAPHIKTLNKLTVAILKLSGSMALMGLSMLAFGAGLLMVGMGIATLVASAKELPAILVPLFTAIRDSAPLIVEAIFAILDEILNQLVKFIPKLLSTVKDAIINSIDTFMELMPKIVEFINMFVTQIAPLLLDKIPQFVDILMAFIITLIDKLIQNVPTIMTKVAELLNAIAKGLGDAFGKMNPATIVTAIAAFGALIVIFKIMASMSGDVKKSLATGVAMAIVFGLLSAIFVVLAQLNVADLTEIAVGLSSAMLAISAAMFIISNVPIAGAIYGIAGFAIVVAGLTAILAALGGLAQIEGLEWLLGEGSRLLSLIGSAIGEFVGNLVGGVLGGIAGALPGIADSLSEFMTRLQPFIKGAKEVDDDVFMGVVKLFGAIALMTVAEVINGIASFITGGVNFAELGRQLCEFVPYMVTFSNLSEGLKTNSIVKAADAALALAKFAQAVPNSGGLAGFFAGENDLKTWAPQLEPFGNALALFSAAVDGKVNAEAVENAANAGKAIAEMAEKVPNEGGVAGFFAGENSLSVFGPEMEKFGVSLALFSAAVNGKVNAEAVENAANAGKAIAEMADKVPNEGGVAGFFAGENSLSVFGPEMEKFGVSLASFSAAVDGKVNSKEIMMAVMAASALVTLTNMIPNEGGVASWFAGENSLSVFGPEMVKFGESLALFSAAIDGKVNAESIMIATTAASALVTLTNIIPNEGGIVGLFSGSSSLSKFGEELPLFGASLAEFSAAVDGTINASAVVTAVIAATPLVDLTNKIPDENGVKAWFSNDNSISKNGKELIAFGDALAKFSAAVDGKVNAGEIVSAVIGATAIANLMNTIPNSGGVISWFVGEKSLSKFGKQISSFGTSLAEFSAAVDGKINVEAVKLSVAAASSLVNLTNMIPNEGGIISWFAGERSISKYGDELKSFGTSLSEFSAAVDGKISTSAVALAVVAAASLVSMTNMIPKEGGVISWFEGDNSLTKFGEEMIAFGNSIKDFCDSIQGIEAAEFTKAIDNVTKIVGLAKILGDMNLSGLTDFVDGFNKLGSISIDNFVSTFEDSDSDIKSTLISFLTKARDHINSNKYILVNGFETTVNEVISKLIVKLNSYLNDFKKKGTLLGNSINTGLSGTSNTLVKSQNAILSNLLSTIIGYNDDFRIAGEYLINGLTIGVMNKQSEAINATIAVAKSMINATNKTLAIHSPSREGGKVGRFWDLGIAENILKYRFAVIDAVKENNNGIIDTTREFLSSISQMNLSDINVNPTIRPVMDLSDVSNGIRSLSDLMRNTQTYSIGTAISSDRARFNKEEMTITVETTNTDVVKAVNELKQEMSSMKEAMSKYKIYLDKKTLVGEMVDDMDTALGRKAEIARRAGR